MAELILVVDDEPFVLRVVSSILAKAGYRVLEAASAGSALRLAAQVAEPIDLLLTDVVMPDLNGPGLADRFAELHPETECIFMAGLPDTAEVHERILGPGRHFLPKPFRPETLVEAVRRILGRDTARVA